MILGGVGLNTIVIVGLIPPLLTLEYRHLKNQSVKHDEDDRGNKDRNLEMLTFRNVLKHWRQCALYLLIAVDFLKDWKYIVYVLASYLTDPITLHIFYIYVPDYAIHVGYSNSMSWEHVAISGITSVLARFGMGFNNKSNSSNNSFCFKYNFSRCSTNSLCFFFLQ